MSDSLAIDGGTPVRSTMLPYARQSVSEEDIHAVSEVLRSDWLTTGPQVAAFERAFAASVGSAEAVAVNSGTAALHCALYAANIGEGDEVIVPAMTFAASANAVVMQRGTPVIVDVDRETLLIDTADVQRKITSRTKAVIAVDYAGQPCDYEALRLLCGRHSLKLIGDACHSLGSRHHGKSPNTYCDLAAFSFHPVKPITTGEGGMIVTNDSEDAKLMRQFRHHGLSLDSEERKKRGTWFYDIADVGYNYRLTDIQCALGLSQLSRLSPWTKRRQEIAGVYDKAFADLPAVSPLKVREGNEHAYHLYVVRFALDKLTVDRNTIFKALAAENIGVNLHYIPVHLLSAYQRRFGTKRGLCPVAEEAYDSMLTLPLFASMKDTDAQDVITAVKKVLAHYAR